jgi:hypothetical protein
MAGKVQTRQPEPSGPVRFGLFGGQDSVGQFRPLVSTVRCRVTGKAAILCSKMEMASWGHRRCGNTWQPVPRECPSRSAGGGQVRPGLAHRSASAATRSQCRAGSGSGRRHRSWPSRGPPAERPKHRFSVRSRRGRSERLWPGRQRHIDVAALRPRTVRTESTGDFYTLHYTMIHSVTAQPHATSLLVRGPRSRTGSWSPTA